jgi:hypothetical protein
MRWKMVMHVKQMKISEEAAVAYLKAQSQDFVRETEKNNEKSR